MLRVLLVLLLAVGAHGDEARTLSLDSGRVTIDLHAADGKLSLTGVRDPGGRNWIEKPGETLWKLSLVNDAGETKEIASGDAELFDVKQESDKLTPAWRVKVGDATMTVTASIRTGKAGALSYWSLKADLPRGLEGRARGFPDSAGHRGWQDGRAVRVGAGI